MLISTCMFIKQQQQQLKAEILIKLLDFFFPVNLFCLTLLFHEVTLVDAVFK